MKLVTKAELHHTFFTLLGNAYLQHIHLALHPLPHLIALVWLAFVCDEDADDDEDDKDTDATKSHNHREAEPEWCRRSFVHQLTNDVWYVPTSQQLLTYNSGGL